MLDESDERHTEVDRTWNELLDSDEALITTSYVVVEVIALAQRRLGISAVRTLDADVLPVIRIVWIDPDLHRAAISAVLGASRRNLSLVDCASFEVMRRRGIRTAFAVDGDFVEHGFQTIP
jgi:predicted nucleic acid-binding protein